MRCPIGMRAGTGNKISILCGLSGIVTKLIFECSHSPLSRHCKGAGEIVEMAGFELTGGNYFGIFGK